MERNCMEIRNTDLVKMERKIGELDGGGIEVGVLLDDGERVMVRGETDRGSIYGKIQKMKEGTTLVTKKQPIDRGRDMMNPKRSIDLEDGKNDDLEQTQMMKRSIDDIITESVESVMEIEMVDTCIDVREGILIAVVLLKDRENDIITKSQLVTNIVHHR
jgi:hypothetical protein